jgi:hypothetical protein
MYAMSKRSQTASVYAPPTVSSSQSPDCTPPRRLHWLGALSVCAVGVVGPALVEEGRLGLPLFGGAEGVFMFLTFSGYCAVLVAFAVTGVFVVAGRRIPAALLFGLAMLPACAGVVGALRVIATVRELEGTAPEIQSDMLGFLVQRAYPIASFGFAASGCALLVVVVLSALAHRAALAERSLDRQDGATGRATAAVVAGACVAVVALLLHSNADSPQAVAVGVACVLASLAAGTVAYRVHWLAVVSNDGERGWLWRRAALLPVSAALAVTCFEGSLFFSGIGGAAAAPIMGGLLLAATSAPLLMAASARRAAVRTLGVPFAAASVVIGASLVLLLLGSSRIARARAEGTHHAVVDAWRRSEPAPHKAPFDPDY